MTLANKHPRLVLLGLLGACLALAAVFLLGSDTEPSGAADSSEQFLGFAVLEPASPEALAALPAGAREWLGEGGAGPGSNSTKPVAVGASAKTPAGEVAFAQFDSELCAYFPGDESGDCGGAGLINDGKLLLVAPGCDSATITGVLPDGFERVEVRSADGSAPTSAAVEGNVYRVEVAPVETVVAAAGEDGASVEVPVPLGRIAAGTCGTGAGGAESATP